MGTAMTVVIKTENKSVSRLRNVNYPTSLSPEDELAIKNQNMCWVSKTKFVDGSGGVTSVHDHYHLSNPFLLGVATFADWLVNDGI